MSTLAVPDGYTLHKENSAQVLLSKNEAFLNPVQEFNRDLSVACIRVWSEEIAKSKQEKWEQRMEKKEAKKRRIENHPAEPEAEASQDVDKGQPYKFTLLEPLSATGLRSIRYAKEIPLVKQVIANDLSPSATEAIRRNLEFNDLAPSIEDGAEVKVKVVEGDACALMYSHRAPKSRVDVVDLDPYGTASPFIDAAVQCVKDEGLLCITCTDLSVLATTNYPEKCYSNYGGVPVKAEYCHEAALRLVLHAVSTSASRYGRYIEPLVSLSIDFYVRIFVRVKTSPIEVKKALTKAATYYVCTSCQSPYEQPLGKVVEKAAAAGNTNYLFKIQNGPLMPERCPECQSTLHVAGPMWSGPLHSTEFTSKVLEHLEANQDHYGTATRMKGMLTVAKEELNVPFYFTPAKVASFFHCTTPSLEDVASALLHAGHQISRSHACAGSLKTTAPRSVLHSVYRSWTKANPVKMENVTERSPARQLLAKEPDFEANFHKHADTVTPSSKVKLVRYQENPTPNWGPKPKAIGAKRKRTD